jgi:uncharacterized alpha-E superfamily protein
LSLLARYAENLFWLARYIERASSLARIIETHMAYDRGHADEVSWAWLVALYSDQAKFASLYEETSFKSVLKFYIADLDNPGSVRFALRAARENARALRAVIPTEMWAQLNEFYNRYLVVSDADLDPIRLSRTCSQIKYGCYAQLGVVESTLYRDEGWPFFVLGLMIERADQTSRLLDVKFAQLYTDATRINQAADAVFWALVLRSAAAYQAYHRVEHHGTAPNRVARFLLVNPGHPQSIKFCLGEVQRMLGELRTNFQLHQVSSAQQHSAAMVDKLQRAASDERVVAHLHGINDDIQRGLMVLTNDLAITFFGYPEPAQSRQKQSQA